MKPHVFWMAGLLAAGFVVGTSCGRGRTASETVTYAQPAPARTLPMSNDENNNVDIYKRANPAVVAITSTVLQEGWFRQLIPVREAGSGFFIDDKGTILTNNHVISGREPRVQVTLASGKRYQAQILHKDRSNDLAIIKIDPTTPTKFLPLGDSDRLQVGQKVLAIGNPFGFLEGSLTTGVVSSLNRDIDDETGNKLSGMIQTDAAINPGNSGGPLLDSQGNVIGVNTAIYGSQGNIGIGFAMPIAKARQMIDDVRSGKPLGRPALGVEVVLIRGDLAAELGLPEEGGLLIQRVYEGGSAEAAGLRGAQRAVRYGNDILGIGGDLILAIDGKPVRESNAISRALTGKRPGDRITVKVFRGRATRDIEVRLMAAPDSF
jgi:S1-C subfamily serine protease